MKVLFYVEPRIERNDPWFRLPTVRGAILPQIRALRRAGADTHIIFGEQHVQKLRDQGVLTCLGSYSTIDPTAMKRIEPLQRDWERQALEGTFEPEDFLKIQQLVLDKLDFDPDIVIVWETASRYLRKIFKGAKFIEQLPGPFSREPFGQWTLFLPEILKSPKVDSDLRPKDTLHEVREGLAAAGMPDTYTHERINRIRASYSSIILFPLQAEDYFMVDAPLRSFGGQLEAIEYVCENSDENTAVLVTFYRTGDVRTRSINEKNVDYLKGRYSNLIVDEDFIQMPNASQRIVPLVDGVAVNSSSVAYQAALWRKPILALTESHVSHLSTAQSFPEFVRQISEREVFTQDSTVEQILKRYSYPMERLASKPYEFYEFIDEYDDVQGFAKGLTDDILRENLLTRVPAFREQLPAETSDDLVDVFKSPNILSDKQIISFDVFDTLLVRPMMHPTDLFEFVALLDGGLRLPANIDFAAERRAAEKEAFTKGLEDGRNEITLAEIYRVLSDRIDISQADAASLSEIEMELERRLLYRRESVGRIYDHAKSIGKTVNIISDMYLPSSLIKGALESHGYEVWDRFYLSSEKGEKKHSGRLYPIYLKDIGAPPNELLHVGDNIKADVVRASEHGITGFHVEKPVDIFVRSKFFKDIWARDKERHSLSTRTMLGLIGNALYDSQAEISSNRIFPGGLDSLGYSGLGPLLLSFANWLLQEAKRDGVTKLFFLSRDGLILKRAYDAVASHDESAPLSEYLRCSRRAANVASLMNEADLIDLLYREAGNMTLGEMVEVRFGVPLQEIMKCPDTVPRFNDLRHKKVLSDRVHDFVPALLEVKDHLLERAAIEREAYQRYLDISGINEELAPAVVDVGYAGTMQRSLQKLKTGSYPLGGYYLMTFRSALGLREEGLTIKGYLGDFVDRHDTYHPFCRYVPLYESLLCDVEPSLKKFELSSEGVPVPCFQPEVRRSDVRKDFVERVHGGAYRFVKDYSNRYGELQYMLDFEPMKSMRTLGHFFSSPTRDDAKMLDGLQFEDFFGYGSARDIFESSTNDAARMIWREGYYAAHSKGPRNYFRQKFGFITSVKLKLFRPILVVYSGSDDAFLRTYDSDPAHFFRHAESRLHRAIGRFLLGRFMDTEVR